MILRDRIYTLDVRYDGDDISWSLTNVDDSEDMYEGVIHGGASKDISLTHRYIGAYIEGKYS